MNEECIPAGPGETSPVTRIFETYGRASSQANEETIAYETFTPHDPKVYPDVVGLQNEKKRTEREDERHMPMDETTR